MEYKANIQPQTLEQFATNLPYIMPVPEGAKHSFYLQSVEECSSINFVTGTLYTFRQFNHEMMTADAGVAMMTGRDVTDTAYYMVTFGHEDSVIFMCEGCALRMDSHDNATHLKGFVSAHMLKRFQNIFEDWQYLIRSHKIIDRNDRFVRDPDWRPAGFKTATDFDQLVLDLLA